MKIRELREGADEWEEFDEEGWEEVEAEKQPWEADEGREKGKEVRYDGGSSVEVDSWGWEWEEVSGSCIGGEVVSDERDGMSFVGGLGKKREEVRGGGVGGEVIPDEHVRSSGLRGKLVPYAKRAAAEVCARALFYPTLFVNIGRNVIDPEHHWFDRID